MRGGGGNVQGQTRLRDSGHNIPVLMHISKLFLMSRAVLIIMRKCIQLMFTVSVEIPQRLATDLCVVHVCTLANGENGACVKKLCYEYDYSD